MSRRIFRWPAHYYVNFGSKTWYSQCQSSMLVITRWYNWSVLDVFPWCTSTYLGLRACLKFSKNIHVTAIMRDDGNHEMTVQNTLFAAVSVGAILLALVRSEYGNGLMSSVAILFLICLEKLRREWSLRLDQLPNISLLMIFEGIFVQLMQIWSVIIQYWVLPWISQMRKFPVLIEFGNWAFFGRCVSDIQTNQFSKYFLE